MMSHHILKTLHLPSLTLTHTSGLMWNKHQPRPPRWLKAHALLAGIVLINSLLVIVPAAQQTLNLAQTPHLLTSEIARAKRTEDVAGGVNALLTLVIIAPGVIRPAGKPTHER